MNKQSSYSKHKKTLNVRLAFQFFGCCCEELLKKDAETVIPIVVTKLPESASSFIYVVLAVGQDPGRTEVWARTSIKFNSGDTLFLLV